MRSEKEKRRHDVRLRRDTTRDTMCYFALIMALLLQLRSRRMSINGPMGRIHEERLLGLPYSVRGPINTAYTLEIQYACSQSYRRISPTTLIHTDFIGRHFACESV